MTNFRKAPTMREASSALITASLQNRSRSIGEAIRMVALVFPDREAGDRVQEAMALVVGTPDCLHYQFGDHARVAFTETKAGSAVATLRPKPQASRAANSAADREGRPTPYRPDNASSRTGSLESA